MSDWGDEEFDHALRQAAEGFVDARGVRLSRQQLDRLLAAGPRHPEDAELAQLKSAHFDGATFIGDVRFAGATFSERAGFFQATFGAGAVFDEATFSEDANFSGGTSPLFFGLALLALHGRVKR